jgi:hypothetical protein
VAYSVRFSASPSFFVKDNFLIRFFKLDFCSAQRTGIAEGGEFYIRPPELLPDLLIKMKIKN